jgi:hypothetical protein
MLAFLRMSAASFRLHLFIGHFFRYKQNGAQLYIPPDHVNDPNPINISYLLLLFPIWLLVDDDDVATIGVVGSRRISSFIPFHNDTVP